MDEPLLDFDIISIKIIHGVLICILSGPKIPLSSSPTNPLLFNPPLNKKQKLNIYMSKSRCPPLLRIKASSTICEVFKKYFNKQNEHWPVCDCDWPVMIWTASSWSHCSPWRSLIGLTKELSYISANNESSLYCLFLYNITKTSRELIVDRHRLQSFSSAVT